MTALTTTTIVSTREQAVYLGVDASLTEYEIIDGSEILADAGMTFAPDVSVKLTILPDVTNVVDVTSAMINWGTLGCNATALIGVPPNDGAQFGTILDPNYTGNVAPDEDEVLLDASGRTPSTRHLLTDDETRYVDGLAGNDALGDGTITRPYKTIPYVWKTICRTIDLGGRTLTVQMAPLAPYTGFSTYGDVSLPEDANYDKAYTPTGGGKIIFSGGTAATRHQYVLDVDTTGAADYSGIEISHAMTATAVQFNGVTVKDIIYSFTPCNMTFYECAVEVAYATGVQVIIRNGAWFEFIGNTKLGGYLSNGGTFFQILSGDRAGGGLRFYPLSSGLILDGTNIDAGAMLVKLEGHITAQFSNLPSVTGTFPGKKFHVDYNGILRGSANVPGAIAGTTDHGGWAI